MSQAHYNYSRKVMFPNGFGVSIICRSTLGSTPVEAVGELMTEMFGPGSYGAEDGLFEVAVLDSNGKITYDTPVADDVLGRLDFTDVAFVMHQVASL